MEKRTTLFFKTSEINEEIIKCFGSSIEWCCDRGSFYFSVDCDDFDDDDKFYEHCENTYYKFIDFLGKKYNVEIEQILTEDGDQEFPHGWIMAICK